MSRPRSNGRGRAFDPMAELDGQLRRRASPEKFWAQVDRSGGAEACWPWTGATRRDGYGLASWCRRDIGAHRLAYALANGPIPSRRVVMHACDNPPCCNPAHLSIGTPAQNNADMRTKGRARTGASTRFGSKNHNAKLNDDLVRELRAAWRAGESIKSIVARTGLAVGTVHPMLHGKTWRHVVEEPPRSTTVLVASADREEMAS